jgi:hypothetical protein
VELALYVGESQIDAAHSCSHTDSRLRCTSVKPNTLSSARCRRAGRYRVAKLIATHGRMANVAIEALKGDCPRATTPTFSASAIDLPRFRRFVTGLDVIAVRFIRVWLYHSWRSPKRAEL